VRELIERSQLLTRRSAILVDSSRHHRARESLVPQCAWCAKVRLGAMWVQPDELPEFLAVVLVDRHTHGICPDCFADVENDDAPLGRRTVLIHTAGPVEAECVSQTLREYHLRELPRFVVEATLPDAGGHAVNTLLSAVSACLAVNRLGPVTVELSDQTYVLDAT
jgi:hypothetical protein